MHDLIYSTVAIQTYKTILLGHVCENHLPIHYQALVKTYILENICIICNLFWLILGYTNFQSSRTFAIFSCFIFQDSLPQSMTRVFKLFILFCLSLINLASAPQLYKKICLKCTTNDWRSIFKIALLTSEICLIMTWICKNHFDKFPHFSSLFFSLQQCTKRLRFLNLFPPYFLLLLSATLTKQFKRDSSHWHFPHKRKQHQMNWNRKRSFDTYYWEICVWLDTITPANFP